jgi:hypothetical protein
MQQINRKIYCFVVQTLLNMFRGLQCPSSGARQTAVAASGFHINVEVEVFSAVVRLLVNKPQTLNLLLDVYVWLNMFRAPLRLSSGACSCTSNLWFYCWRVTVAALLVVISREPDHDQQRCYRHSPTLKPEVHSAAVYS